MIKFSFSLHPINERGRGGGEILGEINILTNFNVSEAEATQRKGIKKFTYRIFKNSKLTSKFAHLLVLTCGRRIRRE